LAYLFLMVRGVSGLVRISRFILFSLGVDVYRLNCHFSGSGYG